DLPGRVTESTMINGPLIVGLGEVLWDMFPNRARFGGALANYVCSVAGLGGNTVSVAMVTAVGVDPFGDHAVATLEKQGVDIRFIQRSQQPTGQVKVQIDGTGAATYDFAPDVAWDSLMWTEDLEALARRADVVCFGTLAQRSELSRRTILHFLSCVRQTATKVLDVNLRPPHYSLETVLHSLQMADVLKLNEEELPVIATLCRCSGNHLDVLRQLVDRFDLKLVALTRGERGSLLVRGSQISEFPGIPTEVMDTVGAGDAFTAAMTLGMLRNQALSEMNERASQVASYVCSQVGAAPDIPARLAALFGGSPGFA
ncbi:MAG: carbohydrate kinase, partial [Planctomycetaceae bacterium]|nr:carbohydrate kinase [Planctomycetaceae bacterium]